MFRKIEFCKILHLAQLVFILGFGYSAKATLCQSKTDGEISNVTIEAEIDGPHIEIWPKQKSFSLWKSGGSALKMTIENSNGVQNFNSSFQVSFVGIDPVDFDRCMDLIYRTAKESQPKVLRIQATTNYAGFYDSPFCNGHVLGVFLQDANRRVSCEVIK